MPYRMIHVLRLGATYSGLNLIGRLYATAGGAQVGADIPAGNFHADGGGDYILDYDQFPENFRGIIRIYNAADGIRITTASINPNEGEWVDTRLSAAAGGGGNEGAGTDFVTIIWKTNNGNPVIGGQVWITTDPEGQNVFAGTLITNSEGEVRFRLFDGEDYYLWAEKPGDQIEPISGSLFTAVKDV